MQTEGCRCVSIGGAKIEKDSEKERERERERVRRGRRCEGRRGSWKTLCRTWQSRGLWARSHLIGVV
jgi:hypothetical protein